MFKTIRFAIGTAAATLLAILALAFAMSVLVIGAIAFGAVKGVEAYRGTKVKSLRPNRVYDVDV